MTIYDELKGLLERMPKARERSQKNKFLATLLVKKYSSRMQTGIDIPLMEDIIVASGSYDWAWRQVLQLEPQLRGTDYDEKQILEESKELELGYQPRIKKDIKIIGDIAKPYKE